MIHVLKQALTTNQQSLLFLSTVATLQFLVNELMHIEAWNDHQPVDLILYAWSMTMSIYGSKHKPLLIVEPQIN